MLASLFALCLAGNRPQNAVNISVISLRAANLTGLTNKDSADYAGDLFFYLGDRLPEPMHCRADPYYPMCKTMDIVRHDSVYTQCVPRRRRADAAQTPPPLPPCSRTPTHFPSVNPSPPSRYVLEVDGSFGGCPDGAADCTKYGACNPDTRDPSGLTWKCMPRTAAMGKANVTQRYKRPGSKNSWDVWKFELSKFITPATWYSTQSAGDCDDPAVAAADCTWRIVQTVKTVNATCANGNVHTAVRARNETCFGACPDSGADETTDCFINCFFGTLLPSGSGGGMALSDIEAPFAAAFEEVDPTATGYCAPL